MDSGIVWFFNFLYVKVLEPVPNRAGANLQMVSQELLIADNSATGRVDVFSEEGIQASGPRIAL
ncbi:TPA: hypothetical protein OF541_004047 [Escherichia coli]|nr:hypothetical protein [Escherichia coli]